MDKKQLTKDLVIDEGYRRSVYKDSLGYSTIGIGRMVDSRKGGGLSMDEALFLLSNDIDEKEAEVRKAIPWFKDLSEARQRALVNMAFQMGVGDAKTGKGLLGFKNSLALVKAGKYTEAANSFRQSLWYRQTPARAERVLRLIVKG